MDKARSVTLEVPPDAGAEMELIWSEVERLNASIEKDERDIRRLRDETAVLRHESNRLKVETVAILERIKVLVS